MITVCLIILWWKYKTVSWILSAVTERVCYMLQVGGMVTPPPLRRSPLSRQPVLTHHHRRHVVITKSTSLPVDSKVTSSTDVAKRMSHTDHDQATQATSSALEEHDVTDNDDDALWLEKTQDLASDSALFIPGRLLGTSDSFCVKSFRDMPRDCHTDHWQLASVDQNAQRSLSAASHSEMSAASTGSHGDSGHSDGDHGDTSSDDDSADAFDTEPSDVVTLPHSAPFVRETHRRHLRRLRRPVTDQTSE